MTFQQFAFNNILRNKRIYLGHFFSSTFAVMVFFIYGLLIYHPNLQGELTNVSITMNTLGNIGLQVSQYLTWFFSFLFILYSVSTFLKTRKKEFGILMIQGMSYRQLNKLILIENMLIAFLSIIVGIGIGLAFSKLILLISASILSLKDGLPFYFPIKAITITSAAFIILFVLISIVTSRLVKVNLVVELLKSEEKPKPEPRSSIALTVLLIILIGLGYFATFYISIGKDYMNEYQLLILTGLGVALVVIGTYFFFTQLSVYVMRLLKKRSNLFYKKTNLLTFSDLIYRLQDNAKTFFIVSIVAAMAFTAIGICAAIGNSRLAEGKSPYAFKYVSFQGNVYEEKHVAEIKKQLEKAHFQYILVSPKFITTENGRTLIRLTDYNEYVQKLGYPVESLKNNKESLIIASKKAKKGKNEEIEKQKNMQITQGNLHINLPIQKNVEIEELRQDYDSILVVKDSIYNQVANEYFLGTYKTPIESTLYGFIIKDWIHTTDIAKKLNQVIEADKNNGKPSFYFDSLSLIWNEMKQQNGLLSIMSILIGIVFFVFATSFLYFRLFTDLDRDYQYFNMLGKIGLSKIELKRIVTRQMVILFFLPIIIAMLHSSVAFMALQHISKSTSIGRNISVLGSSTIVLISFLCMQVIYFFLIRSSYIKSLSKAMYTVEDVK
ncbi:ABC transporter permease [Bacillus cereus]|uniref:ABC transporter permease n=1 Tax=Bacillus cereus TaxID=1396 RepID=UPI00203B12AC|nr:ABC transporter permease [Bacillus cereus]MCM3222925.1 ABC transporter permease [Bacillus cereus]MEC3336023.1 ABC transporter permease [Bacillus cereus]